MHYNTAAFTGKGRLVPLDPDDALFIELSVTKISWTPGFSREVPPLKRGIRPSSQLMVRPY